jgi:anti-sigma regulatory factor (Ser/Thr protein kinase)
MKLIEKLKWAKERVSQSLGGSNSSRQSFVFEIAKQTHVGEAQRWAMAAAASLNFEDTRSERVGIIVNELGNNLVRHATGGQLILRRTQHPIGLEILSIDRGPGFNTAASLANGFSKGEMAGTGLGGVRRQADVFDISSTFGKGSLIVAQIAAKDADANLIEAFDYGVIAVPLKGEAHSGDAWIVIPNESGIQIGMMDGLGHGPKAHDAAIQGINVAETSLNLNLEMRMKTVHSRLKSTCGASAFLVDVQGNKVDYCGIGNVRAIISSFEKTRTLLSQNGTAGSQIRTLRVSNETWTQGFLIMHTQGLSGRGDLADFPGMTGRHPSIVAALLYRDFNRGSDDSTILVMRRTN